MTPKIKRWISILWLLMAMTGTILGYLYWDYIDFTWFKEWGHDHLLLATLIFLGLGIVRGLLILPRTPMLFASIAIFPADLAYGINLASILLTTMVVYVLVAKLNLGDLLKLEQNTQYLRIQHMVKRRGLPIVTLWSLTPVVQTDLIVYAAAILKFRLSLTISGVLAGEAVLNAIYIYGTNALLEAFWA